MQYRENPIKDNTTCVLLGPELLLGGCWLKVQVLLICLVLLTLETKRWPAAVVSLPEIAASVGLQLGSLKSRRIILV